MARGERVRRGVVVLSLVVAGAAGSTRTTEVIDLPVGSWRRPSRARRSRRETLVVSATRLADGGTEAAR
jgi:hypothetical protein